jgi:hypothetical protein
MATQHCYCLIRRTDIEIVKRPFRYLCRPYRSYRWDRITGIQTVAA